MVNREMRQAKLEDARRLVQGGYSRSRLHTALKQKYGEGIRPAKYSELFQERVRQIESRALPHRAVTGRRATTRNYRDLRQHHFLPWEAKELANSLRTQGRMPRGQVMVLNRMKADRKKLWQRSVRKAVHEGWSVAKFDSLWSVIVENWYRNEGPALWFKKWQHVKTKRGVTRTKAQLFNLLWTGWFGHHKSKVVEADPDLDWDTPKRAARRRQQKALSLPQLKKQKKQNQDWIADLRETKRRQPRRAAEMDERIIRLGGTP